MNKVVVLVTVSLLVTSLSSCANNLEHKTDFQLCKDLAKYPSYNVNTKARKAEVQKRAVDCRVFATRIDDQLNAESLANAKARSASTNDYQNTNNWDDDFDDLQRRVDRLELPKGECIAIPGVPCM